MQLHKLRGCSEDPGSRLEPNSTKKKLFYRRASLISPAGICFHFELFTEYLRNKIQLYYFKPAYLVNTALFIAAAGYIGPKKNPHFCGPFFAGSSLYPADTT